jgi:spermine/spermidine synthase
MSLLRTDASSRLQHNVALFLISVLGLFLELLLIRWIGTEVNIFAYLQNTILVVCFMGLGMGCMTSDQPIVLRSCLVPLLVLVALLTVPQTNVALRKVSVLLSTLGDLQPLEIITLASGGDWLLAVSLGLAITLGILFLVWQIFVPIGRILGHLMDAHSRPIEAYSCNIFGSLIGIWMFVLLGIAYQPPGVWFLVVVALMFAFVSRAPLHRSINLVILILIACASWLGGGDWNSLENFWSPYQKLVLTESDPVKYPSFKYFVTVNNSWYQGIQDLGKNTTRLNPKLFPPDEEGLSQYDIPFRFHPSPRKALIVGAGTGNDIAGALRQGVADITAVEIDPGIIALGKKYHPEKPYDSVSVHIVNDDARSLFVNTTERYDVICFGLLDSHTTTAMTNARLDHYVYTKESLEMARSRLASGGIVTLNFAANRFFVADRIAATLTEVFGVKPVAFRIPGSVWGYGGVMFIAGDLQAARKQIETQPKLKALVELWQRQEPLPFSFTTKITTDDWPYLYLEKPRIPILYYLLALMFLILFFYTKRRFRLENVTRHWGAAHWHFFFLGAAFLLLEVQNISKSAVVLGNTWQVNGVIISGILTMILLANLIAATMPKFPIALAYVGLVASCSLLYFLDLSTFLYLSYGQRIVVVGALTALPILFSGIVFIRSFAESPVKNQALGANLLGSLIGGLLQSVTFITGIKTLLLVVIVLYLASALTRFQLDRLPSGELEAATR